MSNGWRDKLVEGLVKTIITAITGGSVALIGGVGTWFGQMLMYAYRTTLPLDFTHEGLIAPDLYRKWSRGIFMGPVSEGFGPGAVVAIVLLLLLIAHVLLKRRLPALRNTLHQYPRLVRFYVGHYLPITVVLVLVMFATLARVTSPFWLVAAFTLVIVPAAVYLIYYSQDLIRGAFAEMVCYVFLLIVFFAAFVLLPHRYGREVFDLKLETVSDLKLQPDDKVEGGLISNDDDVFILDEDQKLLCKITLSGDSLSARLFKPKKMSPHAGKRSLRNWAIEYRNRRRPEARASSRPGAVEAGQTSAPRDSLPRVHGSVRSESRLSSNSR